MTNVLNGRKARADLSVLWIFGGSLTIWVILAVLVSALL